MNTFKIKHIVNKDNALTEGGLYIHVLEMENWSKAEITNTILNNYR